MTTLFDRVKKLASDRGLSIAELERKLDLSPNTLYKLKRQKPSVERVELIAEYFDVSTDYLLGRKEPVENETEPEIRIIQRAAKEMTPEQRKKALKLWQAAFDELFDEEK